MAEKSLLRVVEVAPFLPTISEARALVKQALITLENETTKAEEALAEHADDVGLHQFLAELYRRSGRLEKSLEFMEKAHELSGTNPVLSTNLAWTLATNPDDSIRDGERAIKLAMGAVEATNNKRPEPWDVLAAAYAETGDFKKAAEARARAVELAKTINPGMLELWNHRSRLFPEGESIRMPRDR